MVGTGRDDIAGLSYNPNSPFPFFSFHSQSYTLLSCVILRVICSLLEGREFIVDLLMYKRQ